MFWNFTYKAGRVLAPVLIHYLAANLMMMIWVSLRLHTDAAFLTSTTAVVLLPLFCFLYRKDQRDCSGTQDGQPGKNAVKTGIRPFEYAGIAAFGVICNLALGTVAGMIVTALGLNNEAQESLYASSILIQLIGIGIIVPAMEEVLFRGLVYKRMKEYTGNGWAAIFAAAAIFAVYHGNLPQMLFAFPMAVILILVYRKWDTLRAPIVFHAAVNISSVLMTAYVQGFAI